MLANCCSIMRETFSMIRKHKEKNQLRLLGLLHTSNQHIVLYCFYWFLLESDWSIFCSIQISSLHSPLRLIKPHVQACWHLLAFSSYCMNMLDYSVI